MDNARLIEGLYKIVRDHRIGDETARKGGKNFFDCNNRKTVSLKRGQVIGLAIVHGNFNRTSLFTLNRIRSSGDSALYAPVASFNGEFNRGA